MSAPPVSRHRFGFEVPVIAGGLGAAALVGLQLPGFGSQGPLLLAAALFGVAVLRWPFLGLLVLSASIAVENLMVFGGTGGVTATRLLGLVVFGAWLGGKVFRREAFLPLARSPVAITSALLVGFALASTIWAALPDVATSEAIRMLQFVALALIAVDLANSWRRVDLVVTWVLVGALVAAALTLQQSLFGGQRRAGDNIAGGINQTSMTLATCIPFAFYLIRSEGGLMSKLVGVAYIGLAVPAILLTFSRMNLLVLPVLLLVLFADTLKTRRARGWLLGVACAGVLVGMHTVPTDRVMERVETIAPYIQGTIGSDPSGIVEPSARGYHLQLGFAIARDHPIGGAGYQNYGHLFRDEYQYFVPGPGRVYGSVRSPHSSHVGMLADLGVVGFALWLAVVLGVGFFGSVMAWRRTAGAPDRNAHLLARALTYALGLQVFIYGWYNTIADDKLLWLLVGLAAAALGLTRKLPGSEVDGARPSMTSGGTQRPASVSHAGRSP